MDLPDLEGKISSIFLDYIEDCERYGDHVLDRKNILNASLVCRSWASRLRPFIFERLKLCSEGDAHMILDLIRHPSSFLSQYILGLQLSDSQHARADNPPWFHVVMSARAEFPKLDKLLLAIQPPRSKSPYPLVSRIPASAPRSITRCNYAFLSNLRLRAFDDLLKFSGLVGDYGTLNCHKLVWNNQGEIDQGSRPALLSSTERAVPQEIFVVGSKVRWPFIWLLITTSRPAPHTLWDKTSARFLDPSQLSALERLVRCVIETCGPQCQNHTFEINGTLVSDNHRTSG